MSTSQAIVKGEILVTVSSLDAWDTTQARLQNYFQNIFQNYFQIIAENTQFG